MANRRFIDFPIAASVGNDDIVLIWQDGLNKQTTKATLFAGSPNSLAGLTDVDISALANGQILQYNSTTSKWENVDRTDIDLDQLGDVTIVSPTNGQVLVYNSSTSKWENSSAGFVPYTGAVTTVNLGAQSILAGSFVKAGGTSAQFLKADGSVDSTAYGTGTVTSVALTMPSAFSVANTPVTTAGTLEVTGAGTVSQYIRGDGSLATFPALTGFVPYTGATADVNLGTHDLTAERGTFQNNGSSDTLTVNHTSGSGYGIIVTKGGNNEALYVSKTSGSGNAMTVVGGRTSLVDLALSSVSNTAGDFLTLSGGVVHKRTASEVRTDIGAGTGNGTVTSVAALTLGTSGTDLSSTVANGTTTPVITLNVPTASATNRGALSSADWSTFNSKQNALTNPVTGTGTSGQVAYWNGANSITSDGDLLFDGNNLTVGGNITLTNGVNRFLRIGSSTSYYYDLQTVGDNFQIREAGTTPRLTFTYPTGNATFSSSLSANSGSLFNANSGTLTEDILTVRGGGATGNFGFRVEANNGEDIFFVNNTSYNIIMSPIGGNVLIGTTDNAGFKLDVNGTGRFKVSTDRNLAIRYDTNITLSAQADSGGPENLRIYADTFRIYTATSAVGLTERFTIANTGAATFSSSVTAAGGSLFNANSGTLTADVLTVRGGGSSGNFGFRVEANNGDDLLFVNAVSYNVIMGSTGGNVLIGTTTDNGSKLRVNGSVALPHVTKSANYTLDGTDYTVGFDCASNRTANLPDATTCAGRIYVIYQYNTNFGVRYVTLDGSGSQTIDGVTTYSLAFFEDFSSVMIQSNGSNWIVIAVKLYPPVT